MAKSAVSDELTRVLRIINSLVRSQSAREALVNNFLKELSYTHGLLRNLGHPQILGIETTNHCPYTCIMCPRTYGMTRDLGHMDLTLFRDIVGQVHPSWQLDGPRSEPLIHLYHFGEPMVYRHFAESIELCHARGLRVCISTNPSVWTERRIEETLDCAVDELYARVDGMDDHTSMSIRGTAASFVRGERNIRELARRKVQRGASKPRIIVTMTKLPLNAGQWREFKNHWKEIEGIDAVGLCDFSTWAADVPEINALGEMVAGLEEAEAELAATRQYLSSFACYHPWHGVTVAWDGRVVACCRDYNCQTVLGDLKTQSLKEIWNGARMRQLREEFRRNRVTSSPCATCRERSLDIGLPGKFYPLARIVRRTRRPLPVRL